MSQDLRDYITRRLENSDSEARKVGVTATVYGGRGVQITLETRGGYAYGRLTENQVRDLIRVLETRINPELPFEATGIRADRLKINPDGSVLRLEHDLQ